MDQGIQFSSLTQVVQATIIYYSLIITTEHWLLRSAKLQCCINIFRSLRLYPRRRVSGQEKLETFVIANPLEGVPEGTWHHDWFHPPPPEHHSVSIVKEATSDGCLPK